jgi:hypothetical protein
LYNLKKDPHEWHNLAADASHSKIKTQLKKMIPQNRHELVKTAPIRWADVLSGKTKF